jgi:hypothetical protein
MEIEIAMSHHDNLQGHKARGAAPLLDICLNDQRRATGLS